MDERDQMLSKARAERDRKRKAIHKLFFVDETRCPTCGGPARTFDPAKLLAARLSRPGLTGLRLAQLSGITEGALNALENGKRSGSRWETIEAIYDGLQRFDAERESA